MSTRFPLLPIALGAALIVAPAFGAGPRVTRPALSSLDAQEAATLIFMREEEKLARDMYLAMNDLWPSVQFANISDSEQNHMDAVQNALDKYRLTDPATPDVEGTFVNQELQQLYDELHASGQGSYLAALRVGGLIEEVDIEDNENAIAETDNADLQQMYGNLLRGSRNHLRAFAAEIQRLGDSYVAQYLDQATVDAIIESPMERGGPR